MILVSGLPSSANRLVTEHIKRGVSAAGSTEAVQIWHGDQPEPSLGECVEGERLVVVIPVRSEATRKASCERRIRDDRASFPTDVRTMHRHVVGLIARMDLPVYILSYEGLIAEPQRNADDLLDWLELPCVPWPDGASDRKDMPERGKVFDGNARYRQS